MIRIRFILWIIIKKTQNNHWNRVAGLTHRDNLALYTAGLARIRAVALNIPKWGSIGILGRQLWSFAGDSDRNEVSQALIEPFVNYNLENGWFLISDMVITANWEADSSNRWTVPVGGAGRVFKIGSQAINSRLEYYHNVEKPTGAPDYSVTFTWQFLFPK